MNIRCFAQCLCLALNFFTQTQAQSQDPQTKSSAQEVTIAFYNLENLFHPSDDPQKFDDDRTPEGADQWTFEKYDAKLANMAQALSEIGPSTPAIVGLCELENRQVLLDLLSQEALSAIDYGIIHFESPDIRGVDVGLLYRKSLFNPRQSISVPVPLYDEKKDRPLWTRDQLLVAGDLLGKPIYILVNHWPSRSGGKQRSANKRLSAAKVTKRVTDSLLRLNPQSQIIVMGDFNDNPDDPSIQKVMQTSTNHSWDKATEPNKYKRAYDTDFFNPMEQMFASGLGSLAFRDQWFLFDQIMLTHNFSASTSNCRLKSVGIHKLNYLITAKGRFKGYPFRSMQGSLFTGGYSDHFPVFITLSL